MEQTKNPGDVGAPAPEQVKPFQYLITVPTTESIASALDSISSNILNARGLLYDVCMMRCATGTYLNLYFSGQNGVVNPFALNKDAIPDVVSIPHGVMLDLMRFIIMASVVRAARIEPAFQDGLAGALQEATP